MREYEEKTKDDIYKKNRDRKIFITVGLPYSGKSTLRRQFLYENKEIVLISADQLRLQIYGQRFYSNGEDLVWAIRKHMLENLMNNSNCIFIDETNTTEKRRKDIFYLAKKYDYKVYCLLLDTSKDICIERAKKINDEKIIPIIERMAAQFEHPNIDEGYKKIYSINSDLINLKDIDCIFKN